MRTLRGVTLIELLIAMVVTAFAISGVLLVIQAQQRTFYTGAKLRQSQQNGRAALLFMEQKIALAGYGLDPAEALDFSWYCPGPDGCTRDYTNAPDELVFYARNPMSRVIDNPDGTSTFAGNVWQVNGVAGNQITLEARGGETFAKGQILQLACSGELRFTHVTLAQTYANVPVGPIDLALEPVAPGVLAPGVQADPFRRQDVADAANVDFQKWNRCLTTGPRAFRVDRYRFYVRPVDLGGGKIDPYLVLDQGIDSDGDGDIDLDDEQLVAEGVENLQVAYVFLDPAMRPAGTVPGTAITVPNPGTAPDAMPERITPTNFPGMYDSTREFPLFTSSWFFTSSLYSPTIALDPKRKTNAQGNIRAVSIALVSRSPDENPGALANLRYDAGSRLYVMNFNQAPPWITDNIIPARDQYMRALFTSTVPMPNLASRGLSPN